MRISTLKRRAQFQRVRGGGRWSAEAFVLEGKARPDASLGGPRIGFTVTKKMGGAVVRNRIRRRLRAAIVELASNSAEPLYDYVVVAKEPCLEQHFAKLREDLKLAFERVHQGSGRKHRPAGDRPGKGPARTRDLQQPNQPTNESNRNDVALARDEVPLNPSGKHG